MQMNPTTTTLDSPVPRTWNVEITIESSILAHKLITKLAKHLFLAGAPLYSVELRVQQVASAIGLPLTVLALPSGLVLVFESTGQHHMHWPATYLIPANQQTNMGKLLDLDSFAKTISGSITDQALLDKIAKRVDTYMNKTGFSPKKIKASPPAFSLLPTLSLSNVQILAYSDELDSLILKKDCFPLWLNVICQGTTGMLLAALWIPVTLWDLVLTFSVGVVHGLMLIAESRWGIQAMDVWIPIITGFIARILEIQIGPEKVCFATLSVMSSFSYFPGVPITLAMVEFAAFNTLTGVVRMIDAFLRIFKLGFGMVMGGSIASALVLGHARIGDTMCMSKKRDHSVIIKSIYWAIPLVAIPLVCGMNVLLKAKPSQFLWMLIVGGVSLTTYLVALLNDMDQGMAASICAMVASMLSQGLAHKFNHVGIATLIAGLIWLNPGPPFIRGAMFLLTQEIESSVQFASEAVIRALSIVLGLYVSRLIMTPVLSHLRRSGRYLNDLSA